METITLTAPDISCEHCRTAIEREVGTLTGVQSCSVDIPTQQVAVQYDPSTVSRHQIVEVSMEEEGPSSNPSPGGGASGVRRQFSCFVQPRHIARWCVLDASPLGDILPMVRSVPCRGHPVAPLQDISGPSAAITGIASRMASSSRAVDISPIAPSETPTAIIHAARPKARCITSGKTAASSTSPRPIASRSLPLPQARAGVSGMSARW